MAGIVLRGMPPSLVKAAAHGNGYSSALERPRRHSSTFDAPTYTTRVAVLNMAGDRIEVSVKVTPIATVQALKFEIASRWRVPPVFQRLTLGHQVLESTDTLTSVLFPEREMQTVSMTILFDQVYSCLEDSDCRLRCMAVEALAKSARADEDAVAGLIGRTRDENGEVRLAAVQGLAAVSRHGNKRALAAITKCSTDMDVGVRLAVLRALVQSSPHGDDSTAAMVASYVSDDDFVIREVALEALVHVARLHHDCVAATLAALVIDHRDQSVKNIALEALGKVPPKVAVM